MDILLLCAVIALCICVRLPSLKSPDQYLFDIDSYYYARMAREYSEDPSLPVITERENDPYLTYISETDHDKMAGFLSAVSAFIWRIVNIFGNVSIYRICVYIGPFIAALATVPAYVFIRRRYSGTAGRLGGCVAAVCSGLSASFLTHTCFGVFDTDIVLCLFPLAFMCAFLGGMCEISRVKRIVISAVCVLAFTALCCSWASFSIYLFLAIFVFIVSVLIALFVYKWNVLQIIRLAWIRTGAAIIILCAGISFLLWGRINTGPVVRIFSLLANAATGSTLVMADGSSAFPSAGKFVAELADLPLLSGGIKGIFNVSAPGIINRMGGLVIVLVAAAALVMFLIRMIKDLRKTPSEIDAKDHIITTGFLIWFAAGVAALFFGTRFIQIPALPLGIISGMGCAFAAERLKKSGLAFSAWILALALMLVPALGAYNIAKTQWPSVNISLEETAAWIRDNTDEDSVIASWWDLGYYYQYEAGRRTLGDGGTADDRYFYLLGNMLMTEDPDLAAGIAKMLAHSGTDLTYTAEWLTGDISSGMSLLKRLLPLEKEEMRKVLLEEYGYDEDYAEGVSSLICQSDDEKIIFVITEDMLNKAQAIAYYGLWDFSGDTSSGKIPEGCMLNRLYNESDPVGRFTHICSSSDSDRQYGASVWILN